MSQTRGSQHLDGDNHDIDEDNKSSNEADKQMEEDVTETAGKMCPSSTKPMTNYY